MGTTTAIYLLVAFLFGSFSGAGGYALFTQDSGSKGDTKTERQLSNIEVAEKVCDKYYDRLDKKQAALYCSELLCRAYTQGKGSSQNECESRGNLINTRVIIDTCYKKEDNKEECLRLFRERK